MPPMSALFPIAGAAEAALSAPLGHAARELEARRLAGRDVEFVSEAIGPGYETQGAAAEAYSAWLGFENRYCELRQMVAAAPRGRRPTPRPVEPSFANGRRWPAAPPASVRTVWRLSVSYWRVVDPARFAALEQARQTRRRADAEELSAQALRALAGQPLRPVRPQQPLDVGLFERRLPENPNIVVPDE
ncbi:MAG: hypothetical protein JWM33_560 [Caulobacteraceae bacterium]|nr:hypothetical protein [Caulobacteraceae bacterium]